MRFISSELNLGRIYTTVSILPCHWHESVHLDMECIGELFVFRGNAKKETIGVGTVGVLGARAPVERYHCDCAPPSKTA